MPFKLIHIVATCWGRVAISRFGPFRGRLRNKSTQHKTRLLLLLQVEPGDMNKFCGAKYVL